MDDLPDNFDAIVVGTGMVESILAAAISRVGKSVLHLDSNEFYGESWASFSLEGFENWIADCNKNDTTENSTETYSSLVSEDEKVLEIKPNSNVKNACLNYFTVKKKEIVKCDDEKESDIVEESKGDVEDEAIKTKPEDILKKLSRRFNLDLCPKLLFSKGMLVQLLITSNIARYAEFKSVSRVVTWREGQLEPVPCSRADVFATKNVTVVHKRILVKILTLFANYTENLEEFKGFENKTFLEYLKYKKLPENLIHYILYAIAMGDNTTLCMDGVKNCKRFLESLGRYGNTPFIFPMYGSGELPQCFCRLCAVFGGIYCLKREVEALVVKDNKCVGIISNKKRLNAKIVILSAKYAPQNYLIKENTENISRGVLVTNRSILSGEKESLTLLQFPPIPQVSDKSVTVIELGSGTFTCPDNYFVVHMVAKTSKNAADDFTHVVQNLFETEEEENTLKPEVLWSAIWNVTTKISKTSDPAVENLRICCSVDSEFDYDASISEAKQIFQELFPEEEFLPRAPDPDEIVLDTEETSNENTDPEVKPNEPEVATEESKTTHEKPEKPEGQVATEEVSTEESKVTGDKPEVTETTAGEAPAEECKVTDDKPDVTEKTEAKPEGESLVESNQDSSS